MPALADTLQRLPLWINAIRVVYWPRDDGQVYSIADFYDRLTAGDSMAHKAEATIALIAALYFEQADDTAFETLPEFMALLADMINGQAKGESAD